MVTGQEGSAKALREKGNGDGSAATQIRHGLVVSAPAPFLRLGSVGTALQPGRSDLHRLALFLLVPALAGGDRRRAHGGRLLRHRKIAARGDTAMADINWTT